jgi:hypothetical protein
MNAKITLIAILLIFFIPVRLTIAQPPQAKETVSQQQSQNDSQAATIARLGTWCPLYQMCERYAKAVERCTPGSANYDPCMKIMMPGGEDYRAAVSCRGDGSIIRPAEDMPYRWTCTLNGYQ